jgi:hypothetical protein
VDNGAWGGITDPCNFAVPIEAAADPNWLHIEKMCCAAAGPGGGGGGGDEIESRSD